MFKTRIEDLSKNFKVAKKNIIYILENPRNSDREFLEKYWDKKNAVPLSAPIEFPFSQIKPLFINTDPYYWKYEKDFNKKTAYKPFNVIQEYILKRDEKSIVTKFEDIIKLIKKAGGQD